jgi:hypothetical protein
MKKLVVIALFILAQTQSFSQNLTIAELTKLIDYSIDEFDTYLTQKGYQYYGATDIGYSAKVSYAYNSGVGEQYAYVSLYDFHNSETELLCLQTANKSIYLKIKTELKTLGYKFVNSTSSSEPSTQNLHYSKKNQVAVTLATISSEEDGIHYLISIEK